MDWCEVDIRAMYSFQGVLNNITEAFTGLKG